MSEVDRLREFAAAWTGAGFLRPFLWWTGASTGQHQASWSAEPGKSLPLLEVLAAKPYQRIRLVSLLPVAAGSAGSRFDLPGASTRIEEVVSRRLAPGQRVSRTGILVAASGAERVSTSVLSNRWDSTFLVVDEDGVDPRHASREVRDTDLLASHALLALATLGGLWSGMDGAPFDDDREGGGYQEPRIRLVRCHARAVRGHGLVDEIMRTTLARRRDPRWAAEMLGAVHTENGDHLVDRAAREFLDGPGVRLRRAPFVSRPHQPVHVTPRRAFRLLWLFLLGRVREIRSQLRARAVNEVYDRVERFTQRVTFGDGTDVVVTVDGRPIGPPGSGPGQEESGSVDLARRLIGSVHGPSASRTFAAEWPALRELAFGLVDAGPLPEGCTDPSLGAHRQVVSVDAVSPPPAEPDEPLSDWLDSRPDSLLSRVGRRMLADTVSAEEEFLRAVRRLKGCLRGPARPAANRTLWFGWLVVSAVVALGIGIVMTLGVTGSVTLTRAIAVSGVLVVAFAVASTALLALWLRKEFQEAHAVNEIWQEYERSRQEAEHAAEELIRLAAAGAEYRDWAPVLARMVHQAGEESVPVLADPVDLESVPRPWAFGVARARTDPRLLARLASIIGRRCFHKGWISARYARVEQASMADLTFDRGLPAGSANPDPDTEPAARRALCARVRDGLAEQMLIGDIRALVAEHTPNLGLAELFSSVRPAGGPPSTPQAFLTGLSGQSGSDEPVTARFNRRLWTGSSGYPSVSTSTRIWLPDLLPDIPGSQTLSVELDPAATHITVHSARLDVTAPIVATDLALFFRDREEPEDLPAVDAAEVG